MTQLKISKFCVFCGKKPDHKTNEHIIPQWLIKLTGDPKRKINLGPDYRTYKDSKEFKLKSFAFDSFKFPACQKCNNHYSQLEIEAKLVIEKILVHEYLTNTEISSLMDWMDKIRIGLWLGGLLIDRELAPIEPNFHINSRIREKDRALFIYEISDNWKGLQFIGYNLPAFTFSPSCFALCINNFYFYNMSYEYLIARNLGFPFPVEMEFNEYDERIIVSLSKGTNRIKTPLIKYPFIKPTCEIYQPIIFSKLGQFIDNTDNFFNCEFVKNNCLDYEKGIGKIFINERGKIKALEDDMELCLSNGEFTYERISFMKKIANQVLNNQLYIIKNSPSNNRLSTEQRTRIRKTLNKVVGLQKMLINMNRSGSS